MQQKILIVDDEAEALDLLGTTLRQEGYGVLTANDGSSGLTKALTESPSPDRSGCRASPDDESG